MKQAMMIVLGSWNGPTKTTIIGGEYRKVKGAAVASICSVENFNKYDYGDIVSPDDITGVYANLVFCDKKAMEDFINSLEKIKRGMEGKWRK